MWWRIIKFEKTKKMKKTTLLILSLLFVSCVSVKFPESISINLELDEESAKNLTEALNNSKPKMHMMRLHSDGPISKIEDGNIMIFKNNEDIEWNDEDGKKMRRLMIRRDGFQSGPNAEKYLKDLPKNIIDKINKASEMGVDIKIDTLIYEDGGKKEIKIEVKAGNN